MNLDDIIVNRDEANTFPNLLRLRPPRIDVYTKIIRATGDERMRLEYSYIVDMIRGGKKDIHARDGLGILAGDDMIIVPHERTITTRVIPTRTIDEFASVNPEYTEYVSTSAQESCSVYLPQQDAYILIPRPSSSVEEGSP